MKKEEVTKWLTIMKANLNSFPEVSNAKKIEALGEAIRLFKNEQSKEPSSSEIPTGSDGCISRREFEEIVVEYPPEDLCTYPEYKGKPYFSIKYKEGNDCFIGYGTYKPQVLSRYLKDYFMSTSVTPIRPKGHWIEERNDYGELTHWHCSNCYDNSGFITTCKWDFCPNCGSNNREVEE